MFKQISCLAAASLLLAGCMGSKIDCSNEAGFVSFAKYDY